MPNWVHNVVTIRGDDKYLDAIEEVLKTEEEPISFSKLLPMPTEAEADWYNWNVANWGTKWDACDPGVERDDKGLVYTFDTAWAPPMPVIEKLATTFTDVDIDYAYHEEQGWGGTMEIERGKLINHEMYDIPSSHADLAKRRGGCWCTDTDQVFEDCFAHRVAELPDVSKETVEAAKSLGPGWHGSFKELLHAATRL